MHCKFCFRQYRDDLLVKHVRERHKNPGPTSLASRKLVDELDENAKIILFTQEPERSAIVERFGKEKCIVVGPSGTDRLDYTRSVSMRKILKQYGEGYFFVFEMAPPKVTLKQVLHKSIQNILLYFPGETADAEKYNNEALYLFDEKGERIKKRRKVFQVERGEDYEKNPFDSKSLQEYLEDLPPPSRRQDSSVLVWDPSLVPQVKRKREKKNN